MLLKLQEHAPEALLTQADPTKLSHEKVSAALQTCALKYRDRRRAYTLLAESNYIFNQLASLPLEDTVYVLIEQHRNSRDILVFLLKIAAAAKWRSRCALIGDLALAKTCEDSVRACAIRTLAQIGDASQNSRLADSAIKDADWSSELRSLLCSTLYPAKLNMKECLSLLLGKDSATRGRVSSEIKSVLSYHLPKVCLPADLPGLLCTLVEFAQNVARTRNVDALGTSFNWLYHAVSNLFVRIIKLTPAPSDIVNQLLPAFEFLELGAEREKFYDFKSLPIVIGEHRPIGRAMVLKLYVKRPAWLHISEFSCMDSKLYNFSSEDAPWLLTQAKQHEDSFARRIALFTLIEVWQRVGIDEQTVHEIKNLTADIEDAASAFQNTRIAKQEAPRKEASERQRQKDEEDERERRENEKRERDLSEKKQRSERLQQIESHSLSRPEVDHLVWQIVDQRINDVGDKFLQALLQHHKDQVLSCVQDRIEKEWNSEERPIPSVISYVVYRLPTVRKHFAPLLQLQLLNDEPKQAEVLEDTFSIIYRDTDILLDPKLADLAASRTRNAPTEQHRIEWLLAWLIYDGRSAWNYLEEYLSAQGDAKLFIVNLAASARKHFGENFLSYHANVTNHGQSFLNMPDLIGNMIKLLSLNLPPEEKDSDENDNRMTGLSRRMAAGEFRDGLTSYLRRLRTVKAYQVLLGLANDPEMVQYRDFLLRLCELHLVDLAEYQTPRWQPSAINDFARWYINPPQTDLQLFRLVQARLDMIRVAIERGSDFSYRDLLCREKHETELQRWVASELHQQRPILYRVTRESEVEDGNKPDILILSERCQGRIPIEIKPTSRPNYNYQYYLDNALQSQIIEKYMADHKTKYGVLLLPHTQDKTWEKADSTKIDSFASLIQELNKEADRVVKTRPNVEKILVFGIDLT